MGNVFRIVSSSHQPHSTSFPQTPGGKSRRAMNGHIKTEVEIMKNFKWNYNEKWVSLSWIVDKIKEQRSGLIDEYPPIEDDTFAFGAYEALNFVLSLLEEK